MSEQAINQAIAEACGWTCVEEDYEFFGFTQIIPMKRLRWTSPDKQKNTLEIPNYTGDLNAMHEAGLWMESNATSKCDIYAAQLSYVINPKNGQVGDFRYIHATARQRAEAFLRACGKWVEE